MSARSLEGFFSLSREWGLSDPFGTTPFASLGADSSEEGSGDDLTLVSLAAPLPVTATASTSSAESEPSAATSDDTDTVDEALSDFDAGPLDKCPAGGPGRGIGGITDE